MKPLSPTKPSKSPNEELEDLSNLLYLLYRRNKNQHRRSHWWKHLNIFRRQLRTLVAKGVARNPSAAVGPKVKLNPKFGEPLVATWVRGYVVRWYEAFSQLLAEQYFVQLGVTLLAVLGRVCALVGATERLEQEEEEEEEEKGVAEGLDTWAAEQTTGGALGHADGHIDAGVVIAREDLLLPVATSTESHATTAEVPVPMAKGTSKKKRQKKKINPIDALFDALG
jgi:ribonuclease MRP protein subunit RMP1